MKLRNSFVSNSSTTSFVILGIRKSVDREFANKNGLCSIPEDNIVGFPLAESEDWGLVPKEYKLEDIAVRVDVLKKLFGDDLDIRLFSGMHVL